MTQDSPKPTPAYPAPPAPDECRHGQQCLSGKPCLCRPGTTPLLVRLAAAGWLPGEPMSADDIAEARCLEARGWAVCAFGTVEITAAGRRAANAE